MSAIPKGWSYTTFQEAFKYNLKTKHKAGEGLEKGAYRFFTSSPMQSKFLNEYTFKGEYLILGTGGLPSVHYCNDAFATSTDCFVVNTDVRDIHVKFVFYFLKSNIAILGRGFRGAGLKHLSRQYLDKIQIPKPPLETQKKIVAVLEKAEKLMQLREEADKLTDELLKSVFYEMFLKDNKFKMEKLGNAPIKIIDGDRGVNYPKQNDFSNSGFCLFLNTSNVRNDGFKFENVAFIPKEKDEKLRKGKADRNDIVLTTRGTVGNVALYDKKVPYDNVRINSGMVLLRPDNQKILSKYLFYLIRMPLIQNQFKHMNSGSAQPQLPITNLKNANVILPDFSLQQKFVLIVNQIESIKLEQTKSKQLINEFYNTIMQRAFKGELIC